jgi:3-phosphoshikimate 1-carboxyvinyltransferase
VVAEELPDGLRIMPGMPHAAAVDTHHDHRLAMALALMGLVVDGIEVVDPGVVSKSWPGYWTMLEALS